MRGKSKGIVLAYLPSVMLVVAGFMGAELLRTLATAMAAQWPATLAAWLSLLAIVAATVRALWVSWRLLRLRAAVVPPPESGA